MINHGYDQGLEVGKSEGKASARAKYISGVDRDGDGTNEFKVVTNGGATNYFVSNPVPAVYDINGRRLRGLEGDFVLALSAAEAELARLNRRSVKEQENLQASTAAKLRYLTSELNLDQREVKEKYGLIITGGQK